MPPRKKSNEYPEIQELEDDLDLRSPLQRELDSRTPEQESEISDRISEQEAIEAARHKIDPEYRAKSRASFLRSFQIDETHSPANRLKINRPPGDPNVYRWNHDAVRDRIGPENWVPITDWDEARKIAPSAHLRVESDGRIYSGDSYLCKRPETEVEQRNAAIYQRSEMIAKAAHGGMVTPGHENFSQMHKRTAKDSDTIGIRYTGNESDDNI